jgi:lipoprotein-releasing system permease protein
MNAHTMQQLYNMGEHMSHMEIFLKNPFKSTSTLKELTRLLDGYTVIDWKHGDQAIFQAVKIEKNVMFIILTLIVVIAAFNIISTMMMMVKDKYKSIGILKTIGASPSMILRLFMICGSIIGISGTVLGAIVGIFLTRHLEHVRQILQKVFGVNLFHPDIYFLSELPVKILPFDIGLIVSIAFILTLLASFYPAYQASRLSPIEIFKN